MFGSPIPKFKDRGIVYPQSNIEYIKKTYPNTAIYRKLYPYGEQDGNFLHAYKVSRTYTEFVVPTSGYYQINLPNGYNIIRRL